MDEFDAAVCTHIVCSSACEDSKVRGRGIFSPRLWGIWMIRRLLQSIMTLFCHLVVFRQTRLVTPPLSTTTISQVAELYDENKDAWKWSVPLSLLPSRAHTSQSLTLKPQTLSQQTCSRGLGLQLHAPGKADPRGVRRWTDPKRQDDDRQGKACLFRRRLEYQQGTLSSSGGGRGVARPVLWKGVG